MSMYSIHFLQTLFSEMCRHTGLLVCFACLFLSANSSSSLELRSKREVTCSTAKLFEIYSNNGSLSLEGLDKLLTSVRSSCSSYWKEKKTVHTHSTPSHEVPVSVETDVEIPESSAKNGK